MKIVKDLFQTQQPDGSYKYDLTNPAYSVIPWLSGSLAYIAVGVYHGFWHPDIYHAMDFATGFGAIFAGGGIGVLFHSKSQN